MASRNIDDLATGMRIKARRFIAITEQAGLDVLIYCTARSYEEQARLYRQSRTLAEIKDKARRLDDAYGRADLAKILLDVGPQAGDLGRHATMAAPGQSMHNYGLAFDGCPIIAGKPLWADTEGGGAAESEHDERLWQVYGDLAEQVGLEWSGNWTGLKEYPHCQEAGMRWQDLILRQL